jgi:hypothetical protein
VSSFILIDVIFCVYILFSCLISPELCGVGGNFAVAFFYSYPFGVILPNIGSWFGSDARTFVAPTLGLIMHVALGAGIGYCMRNRVVRWSRTVGIATAISLAISFVPALLMSLRGLIGA